jgi:hypothetical protein
MSNFYDKLLKGSEVREACTKIRVEKMEGQTVSICGGDKWQDSGVLKFYRERALIQTELAYAHIAL